MTSISGRAVASEPSPANPDIDANPYFILTAEADSAIAKGDYDRAAARLIDAMAVEPDNPGNLLLKTNLGIVYSALDRDSLATATLSDVISRAPSMTVALVARGRIALKTRHDSLALADFSRAIKVDSLCTDARYFRGLMALYGGDRKMAEADLAVIGSLQPDRPRTLSALGALYSMTGREREAVKYLERLIEDDPAPEFYATLAGCYLTLEKLSDASRVIAEGLRLYPRDPELYYYRAWLNRERFRYDDAKADAKLAIKYGASPQKVNDLFKKK